MDKNIQVFVQYKYILILGYGLGQKRRGKPIISKGYLLRWGRVLVETNESLL